MFMKSDYKIQFCILSYWSYIDYAASLTGSPPFPVYSASRYNQKKVKFSGQFYPLIKSFILNSLHGQMWALIPSLGAVVSIGVVCLGRLSSIVVSLIIL